ncbi:17461_t:CDS:2 [Gigaspora margarita]|uniref:17461_t:CDS:1 n=1 Tax=Gigaspora margarita TaxID=4874 RepID=A0ABM8W682_GIGMA|nr:17461_t:CDS:2 [Gigaspora margarita]
MRKPGIIDALGIPQTSPGEITNKLTTLQGIANTYPTGNPS